MLGSSLVGSVSLAPAFWNLKTCPATGFVRPRRSFAETANRATAPANVPESRHSLLRCSLKRFSRVRIFAKLST